MRQLLKRVRTEVDRVNPETLLVIEGCGDIGREFGDGFIAHGHFWTDQTFDEPFVRFLHPDMRQFESWGYVSRGGSNDDLKRWFIWNSVNGHRAYAHNASREVMSELSAKIRRYYDSFPEICDSPISVLDVTTEGAVAQLFDGPPRILTVGNPTAQPVEVRLVLPVPGAVLLDRVSGQRLSLTNRTTRMGLGPWEYRAFEIRP